MLKLSLLIAVGMMSVKSFALPPHVSNVVSQTQRDEGLRTFEAALGRQLTPSEESELNSLQQQEEAELIRVGDNGDKRTTAYPLYCAGLDFNAAIKRVTAVCINWQTLRTYTLGMAGLGVTAGFAAKVLRFEVRYDSSRYAADFDPAPGAYGAVTSGVVIGHVGYDTLVGDSGNKKLRVNSLASFGFILEAGSIVGIIIE